MDSFALILSHDKHLHVDYSPEPIRGGNRSREPPPEERERERYFSSLRNFGFENAARLTGHIGYMELCGFMSAEWGGETAIAAMNFLAHTDALIIDLRHNGGGGPSMVALLSAYLFGDEPVHHTDTYWREGDRTIQRWRLPYVPGGRYLNKSS